MKIPTFLATKTIDAELPRMSVPSAAFASPLATAGAAVADTAESIRKVYDKVKESERIGAYTARVTTAAEQADALDQELARDPDPGTYL